MGKDDEESKKIYKILNNSKDKNVQKAISQICDLMLTVFFPLKHVLRSGTIMYSALDGEAGEVVRPGIPEVVASHSYGLAVLHYMILTYVPVYFLNTDIDQLMVMSLLHDAAEVKTGDIPDDGRQEHSEKQIQESKVFREVLGSFPEHEKEVLVHFMDELNQKDLYLASLLVQKFWCADKAEAIMYCLYLASQGRPGSAYNKSISLSHADKIAIGATGNDDAATVWAYGYRARSKKLNKLATWLWDELILCMARKTMAEKYNWDPWWVPDNG